MKKILPLIIFVLLQFSCEKDDDTIVGGDIKLDPYIIENYLDDAKQLYFHEIFQNRTHPNYAHPILNHNEVDEILKII